jgi:hypothetical protein
VKDDSVAKAIVDQYTTPKEMLAIDHPDKEDLTSDMLERLTARFVGELQDEINDWNSKYTRFTIQTTETSSAGIDRLNGIVQKLTYAAWRTAHGVKQASQTEGGVGNSAACYTLGDHCND